MQERPSLHTLVVFLAVVEHGTMTAAAKVEGISQPAISAQTKSLEGFFVTSLLERRGRRVRPTAAGTLVADYTRRLLRLADEMIRAVADNVGLTTGQLVIGASSTAGEQLLPAVLGRIHRRYPGIHLKLEIGNTDEIVAKVLEISALLAVLPAMERPIFDDRLQLFVAPDHSVAAATSVDTSDLDGTTFVRRETGSATRDLALRCLENHGCTPGGAGLGIGVLPMHSIAMDRRAGALVVLNCADWEYERQVWLIFRRDRGLTHAEQAFVKTL